MSKLYKVFTRKLFGTKYESLKKTFPIYLIVFWGLHMTGFRIPITPFFLYLMASTFTACMMWQALSSEDNAANMQNLFMLPFERQSLVFSYVSALGAHTLFTKTAGLMAVAWAISSWHIAEIFGSLLCGVNAILMTAWIYSQRRRYAAATTWISTVMAGIFLLQNTALFLPAIAGNIALAAFHLSSADAYSFYKLNRRHHQITRHSKAGSTWRYLFRYLITRKNYLVNTAAMWGIACLLPSFLGQMETLLVLPMGYAILAMNTPICILLSCDPALERAVRFLPNQKKAFCIPYCLFLFLFNMTADTIFLCSWQIQVGGITGTMILTAVFFALQSAICSVLLEWFCPIRGWKIESDLWHHPRKYIVPITMLLLLFLCRRC